MAKRRQKRSTQERETNWLVIGGIALVGLLAFGGLLYLALRTPEAEPVLTLSEYCDENAGNCISVGDENAPVELIEVYDFGCPHCTDFHNNTAEQIIEGYVDTGDVKWVFLPYALRAATIPAAAAAMCADEQDSFLAFTSALFEVEETEFRLTSGGIREAAAAAGIDADELASCLDSGRNARIVEQNMSAAQSAQVTGTPTFFVNGEVVNGNQPFSVFEQAFATALTSSQ